MVATEETTIYKDKDMKTMYLVVEHEAAKWDEHIGTDLFATKDKAQEYFNRRVREIKSERVKEEWVEEGEENEDYYSAYLESQYSEDHNTIEIREIEVNE